MNLYFIPESEPDVEQPAVIAARCLDMPEHAHLRDGDADIGYLFRRGEWTRGHRIVRGTANIPQVKGELSGLFDDMLVDLLGRMPDFLIVLSWDWWEAASPRDREILVFHELSHCVQKVDIFGTPRCNRDGTPVWGLRGHDVEEFTDVVARYGAWNEDLRRFLAAAHEQT